MDRRETDTVPASLADLIARRARGNGSGQQRSPRDARPAGQAGQIGFLFADATDPGIGTEDAESVSPPALLPGATVAEHGSIAGGAERIVPPATATERKLWGVAELVGVLRGRLERDYADVWVEGEISNCRPAASGHLYFTLKDGDAQLPVVLFRRQAVLLKWRPQDGLAVLARGRISVFEGRGQLQMIAEALEPRGAGALQLQFEQLKTRLKAEGLFEAERKRPLHAFPRRIGVVTSLQGAVIRDIVTVCRRRHGCMNILVYPAAVQGAGAAAELAAGIRYLNRAVTGVDRSQQVDVILIARGGGSAEDLQAFNDEGLARTIAASTLPVVSAVGHETDFTIADFVADLRAPTPSAAAEMVTAAQHRVEERVQALQARLLRGVRFAQVTAQQRYSRVGAEGVLRRMLDVADRRQQRVDAAADRLERAAAHVFRTRGEVLRVWRERLLGQDVRTRLARSRTVLEKAADRLGRAGEQVGPARLQQVERAGARLRALSPLAVLERGYALAFLPDGTLLRSASQLGIGQSMVTRLASGSVRSRVTELDG